MVDNRSSYPTTKIQELLERLFYEFGNGEIHWSFVEGLSIQHLLRNDPETFKLFMEIWKYQSSPTTTKTDEELLMERLRKLGYTQE